MGDCAWPTRKNVERRKRRKPGFRVGGGWLGGVFFRSWGVALMHKELEDLRHPKLGEIIL